MASAINIKVTSNFDEASKMLREFGNTTEAQKAKVQAFVDSFKTEKVDQFMDKNTRAAAAVRATQGPMQALTTEHRNLQREIERLIRNGLDPQDEALKPLIQRYQQLEKELEDNARAQKSTEKVSAITAASFLYIAKTAINAGKKVYDFSKQFIDAASSAEEGENKFNAVFGSIQSTATETAEALAESYGMSERASMDMLSATGDLLTGLGLTADESLRLAEQAAALGTDLASFTNYSGGAEGAVDALRKAMLGETEAAKALGLVLNETQLKEYAEKHGKVVSELTLAEKAQMRLNMAMEQSKNAIGDFERSQDSYANQTRIAKAAVEDLKVEIGEALLPAATRAVSAFGELAEKVKDFVKARNELNAAEDAMAEGNASIDQRILLLDQEQAGLKKELDLYNQLGEYYISDEIAEAYQARVKAIGEQIRALGMQRQAEEQLAGAIEGTGTVTNEAAADLKAYLEEVAEAYGKTTQGKIEALEAEISKWEEYAETANKTAPQVNAVLEMLREQLKGMTDDSDAAGVSWKETYNTIIDEGKRASEELAKLEKQEAERRVETATDAIDKIASASSNLAKAIQGDAEDVYDFALETVAGLAAEMGPEGQIVAAALRATKAIGDAWMELGDEILGNLEEYNDGYKDVQQQIIQAHMDANDQMYDNTVIRLKKELDAGRMTEEEYTDAVAAAKADQEEANRKYAYDMAVLDKEITLAKVEIDRQEAIAELGWFNKKKKAEVNALYDTLVSAINSIPLPALQTGTLPSGYTVPESPGTRGDSQLIRVNPGERVDVTPRGEGGGSQRITVQLDRQVLFDVVNKGIRSGEIRITAANLN